MAILTRVLHTASDEPGHTGDRWLLAFDTDTKRLYVEHAWSEGAESRRDEMDVETYLTQGGQTAGHRELWRLLRGLFEQDTPSG